MTALVHVPEHELKQALGLYGFDCLGGWGTAAKVRRWHTPPDRKDYADQENGRHRVYPEHLIAHVRGESTLAVARITNTLVLDADVQGIPDSDEAPEALRAEGRQLAQLFLDTFGLPGVTFDSPGGSHTHVRLPRDPREDETTAAKAILNRWSQERGLPLRFDVYPDGDKAIRLPFGVYLGRRWPMFPALGVDEVLGWLAYPEWASLPALEALRRAGKKAGHRRRSTARRSDVKPTTDRPPAVPPVPVPGYDNWPTCKRQLVREGFAAGQRHAGLNALACEAAVSGETDPERILALLLAVPRPHSAETEAQHRAEARGAAKGALHLAATRDARRLSGCPHVPNHSGHPATTTHRASFEHHCTEAAAKDCPIHRAWRLAQLPAPDYQTVLDSSLWRGAQGQGRGLGIVARDVYALLVRLAGGDHTRVVTASRRYVLVCLANQHSESAVRTALKRLAQVGLIAQPDPKRDDLRQLVRFSGDELVQLEQRLGTAQLAANEKQRVLDHWRENAGFRP